MIRCFGSRVAKWTSSTSAASRSAEAFGMYQLRMVMSAAAALAGGAGSGVLLALAGLSGLSEVVAGGATVASAAWTRDPSVLRWPAITTARVRSGAQPGTAGRHTARRTSKA